jgi:hypothetical protein
MPCFLFRQSPRTIWRVAVLSSVARKARIRGELAQAWRRVPETWLQLETEDKSGDGAKDANRMIGVGLSTIGLGPLGPIEESCHQLGLVVGLENSSAVWPAAGAKPRCRMTSRRRDATV